MTVTSSEMTAEWDRSLCLPLSLLISFSLFQYLLSQYHARHRESRGSALLLCSFLGFSLLVPFASCHTQTVQRLGVVSEAYSILTLLLQLAIVGRDSNHKTRGRSLVHSKYLTHLSNGLVLMGIVVVLLNQLAIAYPPLAPPVLDVMANVAKQLALVFIFSSRFYLYFLLAAQGVSVVMQTEKREIAAYLLFVCHEIPFMALEAATEVSWTNVKTLWMRATIALCIAINLPDKLRSGSSRSGSGLTGVTKSRASSVRKLMTTGSATAVAPMAPTGSRAIQRDEMKRRVVFQFESTPPIHPLRTN